METWDGPTMKVLTARYSDGSGFRVVRVYEANSERARQDFLLVQELGQEVYELHDVPFFKSAS